MNEKFNIEKVAVKEWEKVTNQASSVFIEKYYPDYIDDWHWVGRRVGDVLMVSDAFIDVNDIIDALRFNLTTEQWHEWYWSMDEEYKRPLNIEHFARSKMKAVTTTTKLI